MDNCVLKQSGERCPITEYVQMFKGKNRSNTSFLKKVITYSVIMEPLSLPRLRGKNQGW